MIHDNNPWDDAPQPPQGDMNPWQDAAAFNSMAESSVSKPLHKLERIDFMEAMAQNRRNTWILILGMLSLAAAFGYVLGWGWDVAIGGSIAASTQYMQTQSVDWMRLITTPSPTGFKLAGAFFAGMLVWSLFALMRADKVVLGMADAQVIDERTYPQLHNIVEEVALAAGLPKPKIVVLPTDMPNAFATGLSPEKATVGVTKGLMERLNRRELQAVMAHEMAHVGNDDMRYATILAVMVGVLVFIAEMVLSARHFLAYGSSPNNRERGGGHPIMFVVMIVVFILTAILVPFLARLIQMAISRQREYLADATAVQMTRDPGGLISALQKIAGADASVPQVNRALEPLFIVTPGQMLQNSHKSWFSTHPPIEKRIERLKALE